jgi:hypothetical protein
MTYYLLTAILDLWTSSGLSVYGIGKKIKKASIEAFFNAQGSLF